MGTTKEPCCIAKVRAGIMSNNDAITAVYFDLTNIEDVSKRNGVRKTGQKIEVYYNHTMKSGEVREKKRNSFVSHEYCPFCGKKYN